MSPVAASDGTGGASAYSGLHLSATLLEVICIVVLLARQGVLRAEWPPVNCQKLFSRPWRRLHVSALRRVQRSTWQQVALIWFVGILAMFSLGYATGFLSKFRWPLQWKVHFQQLVITFFMPGLVEEFIFRGLLVPSMSSEKEYSLVAAPSAFDGDCICGHLRTPFVERGVEEPEKLKESGAMSCVPTTDGGDSRPSGILTPMSQASIASWNSHISKERDELDSETEDPSVSTLSTSSTCQARPPVVDQVAVVAIFLCYHFDVIHMYPYQMEQIYMDGRFLLLAGVLGVVCQELLIRTDSLWPGVITHWLVVWFWLTFCFKLKT